MNEAQRACLHREGVLKNVTDRTEDKLLAALEQAREFSLVPWRELMDRNLEKQIRGTIWGRRISSTLGKQYNIGTR